MLRLVTLALLGHVALSAISFNGVPNCRTKTELAPDENGSIIYFRTFAQVNDDNGPEDTPLEHTGFDNGYYMVQMANPGRTIDCYFIVDKASEIIAMDLNAMLGQETGATITTTKYALSGATCETVSQVGTDISDSLDTHTPAGGKGVANCAFLIHMKTTETTGAEGASALGGFTILYGYKAQYYDGTNPNASFASMLNNSIIVAFLIISYLLW